MYCTTADHAAKKFLIIWYPKFDSCDSRKKLINTNLSKKAVLSFLKNKKKQLAHL